MNKLNHLIYEHFAPGVLINSEEKRHMYLREVKTEKMKITAALRELSLQQAPWDYKAQLLRKYQIQVVVLLDELFDYGHHADPSVAAFYNQATAILTELIVALEQHFPEYLAHDIFVPKSYLPQAVQQLHERFRDTEKYLCNRKVDAKLLDLVIAPLHRKASFVTFGMVMYYRRLLAGQLGVAKARDLRVERRQVLVVIHALRVVVAMGNQIATSKPDSATVRAV